MNKKQLSKKGKGKGTTYSIGDNFVEDMEIFTKAIEIGMQNLKEEDKVKNKNKN